MLIQELEIKDIQVKSLEKLLNQLTYGNKENFAPYKGIIKCTIGNSFLICIR